MAYLPGELCDGKVAGCVFKGALGRAVVFLHGHVAKFSVIRQKWTLGSAVWSDAGFGSALTIYLRAVSTSKLCAPKA